MPYTQKMTLGFSITFFLWAKGNHSNGIGTFANNQSVKSAYFTQSTLLKKYISKGSLPVFPLDLILLV